MYHSISQDDFKALETIAQANSQGALAGTSERPIGPKVPKIPKTTVEAAKPRRARSAIIANLGVSDQVADVLQDIYESIPDSNPDKTDDETGNAPIATRINLDDVVKRATASVKRHTQSVAQSVAQIGAAEPVAAEKSAATAESVEQSTHKCSSKYAAKRPRKLMEAAADTKPVDNTLHFEKTDNEEIFQDKDMGGLALALTHGSVLFEVARQELHCTTALKCPDRRNPVRIGVVGYLHKVMNSK